MKNIFLTPLRFIIVIIVLGGISLSSDIAQLTNFNTLNWYKQHYPISLVIIVAFLFITYLLLVIKNYWHLNRNVNQDQTPEDNDLIKNGREIKQIINTNRIDGSTIKMAGRDLNENTKDN